MTNVRRNLLGVRCRRLVRILETSRFPSRRRRAMDKWKKIAIRVFDYKLPELTEEEVQAVNRTMKKKEQ